MFDEVATVGPETLVAAVASTYRQESVLVAQRMAAIAGLLRYRSDATERAAERGDYARIGAFEHTAAEVAAVMNLSPVAASYVVSDAEALDTRLPKIRALLAQGRTDWRTVRLIISRTDLLTDEKVMAAVDESLVAQIASWRGWSKRRILNAVDATVRMLDPDAAQERRETADQDRHIGITAADDGMAEVYGRVAAAAATAFDRRLSQLATLVCGADPRTLDQRRADALAALAEGRALPCACGQSNCPAKASDTAEAAGVRVVINVVATDETLLGDSERPGYLEGYGIIDAEQVRQLAATASLHAVDSLTSAAEALRYQPSAALERAVRCRDLTCRFPGCGRPAVICDLDHTVPFNHQDPTAGGRTVFENLKCLCRLHHLISVVHFKDAPSYRHLHPYQPGPFRPTPRRDQATRGLHRTGRTPRLERGGPLRRQRPIRL
nr:HNH endonuclease signature motif containing protein [Mycobacterium kubicae]